jgi:hypothetical protein
MGVSKKKITKDKKKETRKEVKLQGRKGGRGERKAINKKKRLTDWLMR